MTTNEADVHEYIISHKEFYMNKFMDNIAMRETLLSEHESFKDDIDRSFIEYVKQGIVLHVSKELAIDAEMIYNVLDDISVYQLLEVWQ